MDEIRDSLEGERRDGLTDKNRAVIREVLTTDVWREVVNLPDRLLREARRLKDTKPIKAALQAQAAVAIAILTFAPVRIANLVRTRLEENLIRPGGPDEPFWLVYPEHDVKHRVTLEFAFDAELSGLVDEYLHRHRPVLLRGSNERWLFPGRQGRHKRPHYLSLQITQAVWKHTGLRLTAHFARRVLGHKRLETTMQSYAGLESLQATRRFGALVRGNLFATADRDGARS